MVRASIAYLLTLAVTGYAVFPDPNLEAFVGNGRFWQLVTGRCLFGQDCETNCCVQVDGGFGMCAKWADAALPNGYTRCGFVDPSFQGQTVIQVGSPGQVGNVVTVPVPVRDPNGGPVVTTIKTLTVLPVSAPTDAPVVIPGVPAGTPQAPGEIIQAGSPQPQTPEMTQIGSPPEGNTQVGSPPKDNNQSGTPPKENENGSPQALKEANQDGSASKENSQSGSTQAPKEANQPDSPQAPKENDQAASPPKVINQGSSQLKENTQSGSMPKADGGNQMGNTGSSPGKADSGLHVTGSTTGGLLGGFSGGFTGSAGRNSPSTGRNPAVSISGGVVGGLNSPSGRISGSGMLGGLGSSTGSGSAALGGLGGSPSGSPLGSTSGGSGSGGTGMLGGSRSGGGILGSSPGGSSVEGSSGGITMEQKDDAYM